MKINQLLSKLEKDIENYQTSSTINNQPPEQIPNLDTIGSQDLQQTINYLKYYLKHSVNTSLPNFANRMWSGPNTPAILGEVITAITNTSACTQESAPVSVQMEKYMLDEMLKLVGFKGGEGQMTTGSSNANMIAMMVARNKFINTCKNSGLFNSRKLIAFVNAEAHYSFDKAVNILGIGTNNLLKVPVDSFGAMDINALELMIQKQQTQGNIIFFVAATLGTTVRGAYDNIDKLSQLKSKYGFFLHGDGAWGGSAIMSDTLKQKFLSSVEKLDSFTMDFHKMLGNSLMCNFLLLNNDKTALTKTCALGDTSYIFREDSDLGIKSLQCGRRVDSLKWFLDWQFYGKKGFGDRVERYHYLINYAQKLVKKSPSLEIISPVYSFNLCFRFKGDDSLTQKVRDKLFASNQALLSLAFVKRQLVFRLLVVNVNINEASLDDLFATIITTGETLSQK